MRYLDISYVDEQRKPLVPNKIISGMLPGATQIRIGGNKSILIDGKNQRVTVQSSSGDSVGMGIVPGSSEFGFFSLNASGDLVIKIVGGALRFYDVKNEKANKLRLGEMPDGTFNLVIAKDTVDIDDVFS